MAILQRRGLVPHIDLKAAMDVGQGLIQPLLGKRGVDPMAVTGGLAKFHSSFTGKVQRYARKHDIDVRDLIVRLCQEDQVSAPDELLERLSHELATMKMPRVLSIPAFRVESGKDKTSAESLELLLRELRARAVKAGKFAALNVVTGEKALPDFLVSGNIHSTQSHVVGSVEITNDEQLRSVLSIVDGRADVVLLDVDRKPFGPTNAAETARASLKKTALLTYLDSRVWVEAVEDQVVRLLDEVLNGSEIVIAGDHPRSRFLALRFAERGARVTLAQDPNADAAPPLDELRVLSLAGRELSLSCTPYDSKASGDALSLARVVVVWPAGSALVWRRFRGTTRAENLRTRRRHRDDSAGRNRGSPAAWMLCAAGKYLASVDGHALGGARIADRDQRCPGLGSSGWRSGGRGWGAGTVWRRDRRQRASSDAGDRGL